MNEKRIVIMGAAGRDFHNFNVVFRNNPLYEVVAFTATQIPDIWGRKYPAELAGIDRYPEGIEILPERGLARVISDFEVHECVFSYSDVPHEHVMHVASTVMANGADFRLLGPGATMLRSRKHVVAVTAVRTGAGKSQVTRKVAKVLQQRGYRVVIVRHPMPYGDLLGQVAMRFQNYDDLDRYNCTIEEREEFEPHIDEGFVVYAGVDYLRILEQAESETDVILWDGGNNDLPFYMPDTHIVIADPHRPGHEMGYHPGETNLKMADIAIINKVDTADPGAVEQVRANIRRVNPDAVIVEAASPISVDRPEQVSGKRILVVEDGPTLTHGNMAYGAGVIVAKKLGATLVDPRPHAVGSLRQVYETYPHIGRLLPAMGYGPAQVGELEQTINRVECDAVLVATPIDLSRIASIHRPVARARYELQEIGMPDVEQALGQFIAGGAPAMHPYVAGQHRSAHMPHH